MVDDDGPQGLQGRRAPEVRHLHPVGYDRQRLTHSGRQPVGPGAGGHYDSGRCDFSRRGLDSGYPAPGHGQTLDRRLGENPGAVVSGPVGVGVGGGHRVRVSRLGLMAQMAIPVGSR